MKTALRATNILAVRYSTQRGEFLQAMLRALERLPLFRQPTELPNGVD